jgi:hypothetical protein
MSVNGTYTFPFTVVTDDLTDKEGYSVKSSGAGKVQLSAASTLACGVVRVGAAVAAKAEIAMPGDIAPVKLGGTVYAGDALLINSSSTFEATTPTDGDIVGAIALEGGVSGDLVDAIIVKAHRYEAGT